MCASDMLVFASDHWSFDVRGMNPGGNDGSSLASLHAFRPDVRSAGIPPGRTVSDPNDSLSFVPTLLNLTGRRSADSLPGRVIDEIRTR